MKETFKKFETVHKINNEFQSQKNFISPVQMSVGLGPEDKKCIYVPILDNLKSLLAHEDVLSYMTSNNTNESPYVVENFASSIKYKSSDFFSQGNKIQILLYIDDFTLTNPLGTSSKKHKICAVYYSLGNIPHHLRSKLYCIQLALLCPSYIFKKVGYAQVLKQLIDDIKILETDGILVSTDKGRHLFHGSVSHLIADNLAAHEVCGLNACFSSSRICRFCNATSDTACLHIDENMFIKKTPEVYNSQIANLSQYPHLKKVYGINTTSILNDLNYFHICWNCPSDIAHDLFEGVCLDLIKIVVKNCILQKYFDLEYLNNRITSFSYHGIHKTNKPSIVYKMGSDIKVRLTA